MKTLNFNEEIREMPKRTERQDVLMLLHDVMQCTGGP